MNNSMRSVDNSPPVGNYLRQQRQGRKISLREMARRLHLTPSYLSKVERGLEKPSEETLRHYAREIEANADELLLRAGRLPSDVIPILRASPGLLQVLRGVS